MVRILLISALLLIPACVDGKETGVSRSIQEVKKKHEGQLFNQPGVVSVGIGRDKKGQPAIIVGLDQADPKDEAKLPKSLEGYPVLIRVIGTVGAQ